MNFKELWTDKQFPRWNCGHSDKPDDGCSHEFYEKHEKWRVADITKKPTFNPLTNAVFDTKQGPYDIYTLGPVLQIKRGFLISNKLAGILEEYKLCDYIIFEKIKYRFKGELRDNLNFIYFHGDFSYYINYNKTLFFALAPNYRVKNYLINEKDIVEKNIYVRDAKHYRELAKAYSIEKKLVLRLQKLSCPEIKQYDIFSIFNADIGISSVFMSEKLEVRLKKEKIKGIEYNENMSFNFIG